MKHKNIPAHQFVYVYTFQPMLADAGAATLKIIRKKYFTKKALNKDDVKNKCAFWTPLIVWDGQLSFDLDF